MVSLHEEFGKELAGVDIHQSSNFFFGSLTSDLSSSVFPRATVSIAIRCKTVSDRFYNS